jgi:hypothetical protein
MITLFYIVCFLLTTLAFFGAVLLFLWYQFVGFLFGALELYFVGCVWIDEYFSHCHSSALFQNLVLQKLEQSEQHLPLKVHVTRQVA